jgi:transposase-like protein
MKAQQATRKRRSQKRYSDADRERLIKEQAASGETKATFCTKHGISLGTFYGWSKRQRSDGAAASFVEVCLPVSSDRGIKIELPGGVCVHVPLDADAGRTASLIRGIAGYTGGA